MCDGSRVAGSLGRRAGIDPEATSSDERSGHWQNNYALPTRSRVGEARSHIFAAIHRWHDLSEPSAPYASSDLRAARIRRQRCTQMFLVKMLNAVQRELDEGAPIAVNTLNLLISPELMRHLIP